MRDKVLGFGWPFLHTQSSNSTRKPRLFDWTNDPREATVDVAVYMSGAISAGIDDPGRKVAWIMESPEIARWQQTTPFVEANLQRVVASYEHVLTSDRSFCALHPKIVYHPAAANLPWIREDQYAIYGKTKLCSMFASNKKMVDGHYHRQRMAARLQDKLDLFGGACGSPRIGGDATHPDKSAGMIPYMFQVVMENAKVDFYYTEKITDCFATGTVPIYWGSKCIGELFDTNGIIELDDDFDIDSLNEDLYYAMMPAIRHNFRLVQDLEGTDDLLYRRFIRPGDEVVTPWIPGSWAAKQVLASLEERETAPSHDLPWPAWDPLRIRQSAQREVASPAGRLRSVTDEPKITVNRLDAVPGTQVTIRQITSRLVPPKSLRGTVPKGWPPQLTDAFLLHLNDAFIGDGVIFDRNRYYSMGRWWLGQSWKMYAKTREIRHVPAAVSIGAWGGEAFQHFIFDALPPLAAVIDLLDSPSLADVRIATHDEPNSTTARWFWNRLGLADRIVRKPCNANAGFVIHADLALYPQFEPNLNQLGMYPRDVLRPIQRRLGVLDGPDRNLAVFLQRRHFREVANQKRLLAAVRAIVEPAGLELYVFRGGRSPSDAEDIMKRAKIVLGPHGGAFANLIFAQPGTHVIEFVPLGRLLTAGAHDPLTMYYGLSQAAGLDYWFVEPPTFALDQPMIEVDVDEVAEVLRRILR